MKIILKSKENQILVLNCDKDQDPQQKADQWLNEHPDYQYYDYKIVDIKEE